MDGGARQQEINGLAGLGESSANPCRNVASLSINFDVRQSSEVCFADTIFVRVTETTEHFDQNGGGDRGFPGGEGASDLFDDTRIGFRSQVRDPNGRVDEPQRQLLSLTHCSDVRGGPTDRALPSCCHKTPCTVPSHILP